MTFIEAVAYIFRNLQGFDLRTAKFAVENAKRNLGQDVEVTGVVRLRAYRGEFGFIEYKFRRI